MEEDPLIPLVHVWNNAAFDDSVSSRSAWLPQSPAVAVVRKGDKENHRPGVDDAAGCDVEAEIDHIEAEILRLSSRLHHLRCSNQPEPNRDAAPMREMVAKVRPRPRGLSLGPLDVISIFNREKQPLRSGQSLKPIRQPSATTRGRGLSVGPLEIAAANPRVPAAAQHQQQKRAGTARILKPIKEPPAQRRRGVSLGPLEIHHGVGSKPASARAKPFPTKLNAIREESRPSKQFAVPAKPWPSSNTKQTLDSKQGAAASRAKARSTSPRPRRQSIGKATDTRGANKVVDELKPKGASSQSGSATAAASTATAKRPAGSSKMRVVPSRYSLTPGASLGGSGAQERRRKQSLPDSSGDATQNEEIRAKVIEASNDPLSPQTIAKVAEMLPRIRTMPPPDESPRDSGCAKRVAELVGKRSFFTAAAEDGNAIPSYNARVLDVEAPEAAAEA
ncbi:serine/arginine repetitive matrix protein 2 [Oryza brachyantha]|uniref:serine/arginine repetitive matrix protein 2 n=1 Tax=Oryza brachyantha TaxID=4533 RepID=UPI001ADCC67A|nr:serine/arginine repetitive matrix protein 2 [Oryza brachyantha]